MINSSLWTVKKWHSFNQSANSVGSHIYYGASQVLVELFRILPIRFYHHVIGKPISQFRANDKTNGKDSSFIVRTVSVRE